MLCQAKSRDVLSRGGRSPFSLFIDVMLKYSFVSPFLYRAFVAGLSELPSDDSESSFFLVPGQEPSPYVATGSCLQRWRERPRFRALYIRRSLALD